jgi:glucose-6-phosphate 1-dehydrogenase
MAEEFTSSSEGVRTSVETEPFSPNFPEALCPVEKPEEPCTIVIIGATGDLTARKLMPALYNLYCNKQLPAAFLIVGCGRSALNSDSFREQMRSAVAAAAPAGTEEWSGFARHLAYRTLQYDLLPSYRDLAAALPELERGQRVNGNRIFYCAIPPFLYEPAARLLHQSGLAAGSGIADSWTRIVVEKPFGTDLCTAQTLNRTLLQGFTESQIYRIDHYLAKETVQNVTVMRFANAIFEPLWMRNYIDYVSIMAAEAIGVEHRAGFYEKTGVLRDMFQNHMLQLAALTAMEPPSRFEAEMVRDETAKVFRSLRPFPADNPWENLALGQYCAGTVEGKKVTGYREEPGVSPTSLTPTFALMKVYIDNWRWQGVPFYLTSGKRLPRKRTQIIIQFKEVPHSMFRHILGDSIGANRLTLGIQPDEKITLTFQTKHPGARVCLRSVTMDFSYNQNYTGPSLDAYEKVLLDCMNGDQMLFWRQDAVELCWTFLTPVLETCEDCAQRAEQLHFYEAGTWGPAAARELVQPGLSQPG